MEAEESVDENRMDPEHPEALLPYDSPHGTTMPRHISAVLDNFVSCVVAVLCARQLPESWPIAQLLCLVGSYLAYYLIFESLFCTTPAKFMNGLVIRDFDGGRPTFQQMLIRTIFRILEVNPVFFGGLPAAARIVWTRDKQRFGDKFAGTVVVMR